MKKKVVLNVSTNGCRPSCLKKFVRGFFKPMVPCFFQEAICKSKVMSIAATLPGVEKVSFEGAEKNELTVIGEGIDAVELVNILRKKVEFANVVSVGPEPVEKKEKKPDDKKEGKPAQPLQGPVVCCNHDRIPLVEMWEVRDPYCYPFIW